MPALPQEKLSRGVPEEALSAGQARLYIETSMGSYLLGIAAAIAVTAACLWEFAPEQLPRILAWSAAIGATLIARLAARLLFARARPDDESVQRWIKWFLVPQVCSVIVIGAGPFVFVPAPSGHDLELLFILTLIVYVAALASVVELSAYRPAIPMVLAPLVIVYGAGSLRLPGTLPKLMALGGVIIGVWGYRMASSFNAAVVRAMELSIHNENLLAALEARTARLQEQTLAADEARVLAERAERDKTRFLAAASHDLRQPMHAISLLVGMLRPRAPAAEREVVERLERSVESMDALFGTILDLSKLDAGVVKPSLAAVPLRAIFDPIEVHFAPQAASKKIALRVFASRAIVRTDRAVLERLLRNLVSNAIKYTREGKVLVGCRRRGGRMRIGVWDTGVGVAAENLERIFEEYFQANAGPRDRSEGLGLGLSIVRRLARLLGSEVEVRSVPGRGSSFELEVPFAGYVRGGAQGGAREQAPDAMLVGKFVLVVDDEPDVRFGTEAALRQWGCRSASAGSVAEVGAILERELRFPDAVVTDYRIGAGHTGLDVISAVQRYTGERTPCLIVTGSDIAKAELEAAGMPYPVLKKPLAAAELRRHLVAALSGATVQ